MDHGDRATVAEAVARKVFARGFKRDVRAEPDLVELTERLLVRAVLDALAIAGKSGLVATGFSKVEAALARDPVVALLHAAEARPDGVAKLARALAAAGRSRPDCQADRNRHELFDRRNWIWHWAGQMWYMQPCWPGPRATRFWRVLRGLSAFGPAKRGEPAGELMRGTDRIEN